MNRIKILVIDDDEDIVLMMNDFFETASFAEKVESLTASTAQEAADAIANFNPDIMISDILIPGTDGFRLAEALRAKNPSAHVIIMSGRNQMPAATDASNPNVDRYIQKPFDLDTFEAIVSGAVARFSKNSGSEKL